MPSHPNVKRRALALYVATLFLEYLDMTVVNTALPELARQFPGGASLIEWVVTAYLLSMAIFIPASGWAGDRWGAKKAFLASLGLFTFSSLLCAVAWNAGSLIAFRGLQGIGAALMAPVGNAIVLRLYPVEERVRAAAIATVPTVLGPVLGPIVGGYLVQYHSWAWIFLINVPIGAAAVVLGMRWLPSEKGQTAGALDWSSFGLSALALVGLEAAFGEISREGLSVAASAVVLLSLASLAAFVWRQLKSTTPTLDIRLLRSRPLAASSLVLFFNQAVFMGMVFLLPMYLQDARGLTPFASGLVTFPTALGVVMMAPVAARLYPRIGARSLFQAALCCAIGASVGFGLTGMQTPLWAMRLLMLPRGWAFGLALAPMQAAAFAEISKASLTQATALVSVIRQVAGSFGVAVLAAVVHGSAGSGAPNVGAFNLGFFAASILAVAGFAMAARFPRQFPVIVC